MKNLLHLLILLGATFALSACPDDDDDDSTLDDDDSALDDDDSAADDDDSADVPEPYLDLDVAEIACVDEVEGRDLTSSWTITIDVFGWLEDPILFIWDQVPFETYHFIDSGQPWREAAWENLDWDPDGLWDSWAISFEGHDNIPDAEAAGGTLFRCYDSNHVEQIEQFNYMLCGTDSHYDGETCWFIGYDFGEPGGTTANPRGTVGGYVDGDMAWDATKGSIVTPDDDSPVIFSPSNPD